MYGLIIALTRLYTNRLMRFFHYPDNICNINKISWHRQANFEKMNEWLFLPALLGYYAVHPCRNTAAQLLHLRCIHPCSVNATGLQQFCNMGAAALQQGCSSHSRRI